MSVDEGLTTDEPQYDVNSDQGFRKYLESQAGGDSLPASAREWGAPNSVHRKEKVQAEIDAGWKKAQAQITSLADFEAVITAPGQGDVRGGLELPDDSEPDTPSAPSPAATAEIGRLRNELTAAQTNLSDLQQFEATQAAFDSLEEEGDDPVVVHNTLSELREVLPGEEWAAFQMEAIADGSLDPDLLAQHDAQYSSEKAWEQSFDKANTSANEMDALKKSQLEALEEERERMNMAPESEAWTEHVTGIAAAAEQYGITLAELPAKEYKETLRKMSGFVGEHARAERNAYFQNAVLSGGASVEDGLTIGGMPVNPREEITANDTFDWNRVLANENVGRKVDIASEIMAEAQKSTDKAETIQALARKANRKAAEERARIIKARGGFV